MFVALTQQPPLKGEIPEYQRRALERMEVAGSERASAADGISERLTSADLVLDALIGYSLRGSPREPEASFIRAANSTEAPRLALDLPSGLEGDTGEAREPVIRADATLTLAWPKAGLLIAGAAAYVGALWLVDISVPAAVYRSVGVEAGRLFAGGPIVGVRVLDGHWEPA